MTADFTIPGYDIQRELGRGGMAVVYLAIQQSFGREVALKILPREQAGDADFAERFLREARIVSQLVHPNIVTVYDVGVHDGYRYLSMEYIHGQDLKQAHGSLSRRELLRAIKDVARALDYAASKGYVHRDVKPENIMIREEDGRVVLMDFGIARGNNTTLNMTRAGKAIGTPYYMSPEQTKGLPVDHRSDIYSLGVVLYQMLAGYVPYDADSAVAVGIKHLTEPIPMLPDSLRMLQPVINTAMAKDPAHRYQTAGEMIAALDQITEEQLDALDASAAAFRLAGKDHAATTMETPILTGDSYPPIVAPNRTAVTAPNAAITETPLPRRRRRLLFLLLLIVIVAAGVLQRQPLQKLWHKWQLVVLARLGVSPTGPGTPEPAPAAPAAEPAAPAPAEPPPPAAPTRREEITRLRNSLDENPDNAVELARLYRQILRNQRHNPLARQGLIHLREWYTRALRTAFDQGDLARARALVDGLKLAFPRAANNEKFLRLEQRLERAEAVEAHLVQAGEYLAQDMITEPEGANALEEIRAALALDPENEAARNALRQIVEAHLTQALEYQANGDYQHAMLTAERGLQAEPDNPDLLALQEELQEQIRIQARHHALLREAAGQMRQQHWLEPTGRSAWDLYRQILREDPDNAAARKGLQKLEQRLLGEVTTAIANGDLAQAETRLAEVHKRFGNRPGIQQTRAMLDQAIEARRPKITRLLLSASPIDTLDQPKPDALRPSRSLYVGFEYTNFDPDTTLLQAVLMDGAGAVTIAQKPVVVSAKSGTAFFDIQLPVEGFAEGSYKVELLLENTPLVSETFLVR